ncbi:hypothetical protein DCH27_25350 [Salmonella enterica]|nr:hypothetical protein [Salmonella enterica]
MLNDVLAALDALAQNSFNGIRFNYPVGSFVRDFATNIETRPILEGPELHGVRFNLLNSGSTVGELFAGSLEDAMLFAADSGDRFSAALHEWASQHSPDGAPQPERADGDRPFTGPLVVRRP